MASTKPAFTLDAKIWNPALYANLQTFWFDSLSRDAILAPVSTMQKWWGFGKTVQEKQDFDQSCRSAFAHALDSMSPAKIGHQLPPFKSYQDDLDNHLHSLSAPFLETVSAEDDPEYPWQLLSIVILLDQIPRNIYRTADTLPLVYRHYDRFVFALLHTVVKNKLYVSPAYRSKPPFYTWLVVPCEHAEHLPTLDMGHQKYLKMKENLKEYESQTEGFQRVAEQLEGADKAFTKHLEPMQKFGRYPHRNACLGRQNTPEEEEYLKSADTFGVSVQK